MFKQLELKGKTLASETFTLEISKLKLLLKAMPLSQNNALSAEECPLSLLSSFGNLSAVLTAAGVKPQNALLSREHIAVQHLPKVGDSLQIDTLLSDLYEQQGSTTPMGFLVVHIIGKKNKTPLFKVEQIIAIRGGFQRSSV